MSNCPKCGNAVPTFVIEAEDGTTSPAPVDTVNDIVTIPYTPDSVFAAIGVEPIVITPDPNDDHAPTFTLAFSTDDFEIVDGELTITPTASTGDWSSPNATTPLGGIVVYPGGTDGGNPSFGLAIADGSNATINADGQLVIECCPDLPWSATELDGITITPGDNPTGDPGNGHRPAIGVKVDGTTIDFDDNGNLEVIGGGGNVDVCATVQALPAIPGGVTATATLVVGDDGNCYQADPATDTDLCATLQALPTLPANVEPDTSVVVGDDGNCYQTATPCILTADAGGDPWDAANANYIDPTTVDEFCELRLTNGATGSEIWRMLSDVGGTADWAQVA